jgi:hypothetical protein
MVKAYLPPALPDARAVGFAGWIEAISGLIEGAFCISWTSHPNSISQSLNFGVAAFEFTFV